MTRALIPFLCLLACGDDDLPPTDAGRAADAGSPDGDSGPPEDAAVVGVDAANADAGLRDAGGPLCEGLGDDVEVCTRSALGCELVFRDGAGCAAVCAAAGLSCTGSYEDVEGACMADGERSALDCADTGHGSDYCVCGESGGECGDGSCDVGESCSSCPADCGECPTDHTAILGDLVGFAETRGGADGPVVIVTSLAAEGPGTLSEALDVEGPKWITFTSGLSGTIERDGYLDVPAETTLDGRGADVTLAVGLRMAGEDAHDVILHNLQFAIPDDGDDAIQIRNGATDVWIDHCTIASWTDGAIDVTNGVEGILTRVTVSWTRLHGGSKGMLISATSDPSFGWRDENLRVTHHHNWYEGVDDRLPRVRFAQVHVFDNVFLDWRWYAIGASTRAQVVVENNVFEPGEDDDACTTECIGADCDHHEGAGGSLRAVGNSLGGDAVCETSSPVSVFTPPYEYDLEVADASLRARVDEGAGWQDVPFPGE